MEFSRTFSGFVEILTKSYKIFSKNNGKLIHFITLIFLLLSSILLLCNILLINPNFVDLIVRLSVMMLSPSSANFANLILPSKPDLQAFAGIEWLIVVASTAASLLFVTSAILSSSAERHGIVLHPKGLVSLVSKAWKRPFVTLFYTTLLDMGYVFFALAFVAPLAAVFDSSIFLYLACLSLALVYFYLAVVWTLAIVVSILEEKRGIVALARAGELVDGLRVKGFLLKLIFGCLYYVLLQLLRSIDDTRSIGARICVALVVVNSVCFVKMLSLIAYTVFYYDCKDFHGEVDDFGGQFGLEYSTKAAGTETPLITADHMLP